MSIFNQRTKIIICFCQEQTLFLEQLWNSFQVSTLHQSWIVSISLLLAWYHTAVTIDSSLVIHNNRTTTTESNLWLFREIALFFAQKVRSSFPFISPSFIQKTSIWNQGVRHGYLAPCTWAGIVWFAHY